MLKFDYDLVNGQFIEAVVGDARQVSNDGSVKYDRIMIKLKSMAILIDVNLDNDEINVALKKSNELPEGDFSDIPELSACAGKKLGWGWEGRNYRGYWDFFSISISGIEPDYCFVGIASKIALNSISKITCDTSAK